MRGIGKSRLMATFVTVVLVLSMLVIIPRTSMAAGPSMTISKKDDLTCGEVIWINGTGLDPGTYYVVQIGKVVSPGWNLENITSKRTDENGNVSIEIHVPYRSEPGSYRLVLANESDSTDNITDTINIKNIYKVEYEVNGEKVEYAIWNKEYAYPDDAFVIKIYNWTGNKYELLDETVNVTLYEPDENIALTDNDVSGGEWSIDYTFNYTDGDNYETNYWVKVFDGSTLCANFTLPVLLDVTATIPSAVVWGDDITINGYVKDGKGNGIGDYVVKLYYPINGGYKCIDTDTTYNTGRFTLSAATDEGSAGTWYIGTEISSGSYRVSDYHNLNGVANFIWYYKIDVRSDNTADIEIKSPDEIISGFTQNISVYVEWNDNPLDGAWVYLTGLKANYSGTEYDADANISVGQTDSNGYCNFSIKFLETGTGTIFVTWPEMNENYTDDYKANVTGTTTFEVTAPAPINVIVENPPTEVKITDLGGGKWVNDTSIPDTIIYVYGNSEDKPINATINITGCGLNINIDEDDATYRVGTGEYHVKLNPKTGGIITITVTNTTVSSEPVTKEYEIKGLYGIVRTSIGDDKKITVETNETIIAEITGESHAEVHATFLDKDWGNPELIYSEIGDGTAGKGLNGKYTINITKDNVDKIGHVVVVAEVSGFWFYDIVDIVPVHDLVINISEPTAENQTLTVGIPVDVTLKVQDPDGNVVDNVDSVTGKIIDDEGNTLQEVNFGGPTASDEWYLHDWIPWYEGTFIITAKNNTGENEHDGNITLNVGLATVTFDPDKVTAGIGLKNITVNVTAIDANGNPLPEGTILYLNYNNTVVDLESDEITLDAEGKGSFKIKEVYDKEGKINATLQDYYAANKGNLTNGELSVEFPTFVVDPSEIYIGMSNTIKITAYDVNGNPIPGINITLVPSLSGILTVQPDPVMTGEDGMAILSVTPQASGKLNVTIARNLHYENGRLNWTNAVVTDTVITVTSLKPLEISVSATPIYEGETLTVTVKSGNNPVEGAIVKFGTQTETTDSSGQATFEVPDPGVEFAVFTVTAEKTGYTSAEKSVTVIKKYEITIVGPSEPPKAGSKFTITIIAKGAPLAGATIEFNGKTYTSDGEGKVTLTAPSKPGKYTVRATYENFDTGTLEIEIKEGGIPGFELVTLIAAIGVAFILLRKRH